MTGNANTPAVSIPLVPVVSSQLAAVGYDPQTSTLAVEFKGYGDKPGSVYHYADVDQDTWAALNAAPSFNSEFIKRVKKDPERFPYTKLAPVAPIDHHQV